MYQHEVIIPNNDLPFKLFSFEGEAGAYRREKHWHSSVELFAVWDGQLIFELDDDRFSLGAGDFVIVNSNEIHAIEAPQRNRTVVAQIPLDEFANFFTDDGFIWFTHEKRDADRRLYSILQEMKLKYDSKELASSLQVQSMYYELLHLMITEYRTKDVDADLIKNTRQLKKLREITRFIKKHYDEELTLGGVAAEFGYASTYLSRSFVKYAGINFKDYLVGVRLEHAIEELENTNHRIGEIALNNGFPNSKAFACAFKDRFGCLPSEYKYNLDKAKG